MPSPRTRGAQALLARLQSAEARELITEALGCEARGAFRNATYLFTAALEAERAYRALVAVSRRSHG